MDMEIDLNADLGEGYGPWRMGDDAALLAELSSANVACGFHAGDPSLMTSTVRTALQRGVDIGAHVGYDDRQGFGRRVIAMEWGDLSALVSYQLGALAGICRVEGARMTHMSFHGALGNQVAADTALADALVGTVAAFDPGLIISTSSSQAIEQAAARHGLRTALSFLADRAYDDNGLLVSRQQAGAVIHDEQAVLARVRRLLTDGTVLTHSGRSLPMPARSILVHGDTPGALRLARAVRSAILDAGGRVVPLTRQAGLG
jgi:UPF0271 protein